MELGKTEKGLRKVKLLLLGDSMSGKSTLLKQMSILYGTGISMDDRKAWRTEIFNVILQSCTRTILAMAEQDIDLEMDVYDKIVHLERAQYEIMPQEYLRAFKLFWADSGVQLAMMKGNEYCSIVPDLNYFLADIDRICAKDYMPTDEDILRTQVRTTGFSESKFDIGGVEYRIIDIGGARAERKKWTYVAGEDVQVVVFVVALSGYDSAPYNDPDSNQILEALAIFKRVVSWQNHFQKTDFFVLLNKTHLFREKLASGMSPIRKYFPEYRGKSTDIQTAEEFFADKFRQLFPAGDRKLYLYYTNAIDTDSTRETLESMHEIVVRHEPSQPAEVPVAGSVLQRGAILAKKLSRKLREK